MLQIKKLSAFCLLVLSLMAVACSSGNAANAVPAAKSISNTFNTASFHSINVASTFDVTFEQSTGNTTSVVITASENYMQYVNVSTKEGELYLSFKYNGELPADLTLKAHIKAPSLHELELSGAAKFQAETINMSGREFELSCAGSANVNIAQLSCTEADVEIMGASKVNIKSVNAIDYDMEVAGASNFTCNDFNVSECDVDCAGASSVELRGEALKVDFEASGASHINAANLVANTGELSASGTSSITANVVNVIRQTSSGSSSIKLK